MSETRTKVDALKDLGEKVTGKTLTLEENETVVGMLDKITEEYEGGGSGGTSDYADLSNKPQINGVTLSGNKTSDDLGITESFIISLNTELHAIQPVEGIGGEINNQSDVQLLNEIKTAVFNAKDEGKSVNVTLELPRSGGVTKQFPVKVLRINRTYGSIRMYFEIEQEEATYEMEGNKFAIYISYDDTTHKWTYSLWDIMPERIGLNTDLVVDQTIEVDDSQDIIQLMRIKASLISGWNPPIAIITQAKAPDDEDIQLYKVYNITRIEYNPETDEMYLRFRDLTDDYASAISYNPAQDKFYISSI